MYFVVRTDDADYLYQRLLTALYRNEVATTILMLSFAWESISCLENSKHVECVRFPEVIMNMNDICTQYAI